MRITDGTIHDITIHLNDSLDSIENCVIRYCNIIIDAECDIISCFIDRGNIGYTKTVKKPKLNRGFRAGIYNSNILDSKIIIQDYARIESSNILNSKIQTPTPDYLIGDRTIIQGSVIQ